MAILLNTLIYANISFRMSCGFLYKAFNLLPEHVQDLLLLYSVVFSSFLKDYII